MCRKLLVMAVLVGLALANVAHAGPWDKVKRGAGKVIDSDVAKNVVGSSSSSSSGAGDDSAVVNAYAKTIIYRQYAILKLAEALEIKGLAQEKKDVATKLGEANGSFSTDDISALVATSSETMQKVGAKLDEVKELTEVQKKHVADAMGLFDQSLQAEAEKSAELKKFITNYLASAGIGAATGGFSAGSALALGGDALARRNKYKALAREMDSLGAETMSLQYKVNAIAARNNITANPTSRMPDKAEFEDDDDDDGATAKKDNAEAADDEAKTEAESDAKSEAGDSANPDSTATE